MFCENCGHKIQDGNKFCINCGHRAVHEEKVVHEEKKVPSKPDAPKMPKIDPNEKWWHRLLTVFYIFLYLQILWIVPATWNENSSSYIYNGGKPYYEDTYGQAFWYSLLAVIIFVVVIRLFKITVLYIAMGQRPEWKKELKKLF